LESWARNLGTQFFQLGNSLTKYNDLQARFSTAPNIDVRPINLTTLISDFVKEMGDNLKEKVAVIKKIKNSAEEKALEYYEHNPDIKASSSYFNSKKDIFHISDVNDCSSTPTGKICIQPNDHFKNFVNTNFSTVHVPTRIYEKHEDLLESIGWSSNIDPTFVSNFKLNPTLSYQYFGSTTGILRHYPAMMWPNNNSDRADPDLYDCRTRPWYIQAVNSPKNMLILYDVSGSMTGIRRLIAKHIIYQLLDTLTENDYVNVYNFSDSTKPLIPCLKNRLVQANMANVRGLKLGLEQDQTAGIANFTRAINGAFDVLENARKEAASSHCNEAIMIITDGAPLTFEEVFKSRQNPEHYVRVFTYLVGREVTEKREVLEMACANKGSFLKINANVIQLAPQIFNFPGYFTHVSMLTEVHEKVLKYMPVMSRSMTFFENPEESWTPVYAHIAAQMEEHYPPSATNPKEPMEPFDFVISASVPVFDRRNSSEFKTTLLGVAGTDIPIRSLRRFASPFKLGVNGYAFMVNHNGHIVFHPDWRPVFDGRLLKPVYNAVDLTERRVTLHSQHYEFQRVKVMNKQKSSQNFITPYTLAIAFSEKNANEFIGKLDTSSKEEDILSYFEEINEPRKWKINPDWSYCDYIQDGEKYKFSSKEDLLLNFLRKIQRANGSWLWRENGIYECGEMSLPSELFKTGLFEMSGVSMAFIATQTGLTRWIDFTNDPAEKDSNDTKQFIEENTGATNELWYKRNDYDPESFVYTVPFNAGNDSKVTATRAIFVTKNGVKAPVAVVGFQFSLEMFTEIFLDSTSEQLDNELCNSGDLTMTMASFLLVKYMRKMLTVLLEIFWELNGMVMESLVASDVYKRVRVVDYQAVCLQATARTSFANALSTPLRFFQLVHLPLGLDDPATQSAYVPQRHSAANRISNQQESTNRSCIRAIKKHFSTHTGPATTLITLATTGWQPNVDLRDVTGKRASVFSNPIQYFSVNYIPHTNLILVVTNGKCRCSNNKMTIEHREVEYDSEFSSRPGGICRTPMQTRNIKRAPVCIKYSPREDKEDIREDCGSSSKLFPGMMVVLSIALLIL
ncbi:Voltage-dependent calcium channel subunit alpha-2/delta-4, partial [Orchesella cincta]